MNETRSRAEVVAAWLRADAEEAAEVLGDKVEAVAMNREAADLIDSLSQVVRPRIVTDAAAIIKAVAKPCI